MIDVKEAAQTASNFFAGLYADQTLSDVRLEEVELTEDERFWLITLSFPSDNPLQKVLTHMAGIDRSTRQYKIFKVDASTGRVVSMKIRNT